MSSERSPLTQKEIWAIFDTAAQGASLPEARRLLPGRHRRTVDALYGVAREFFNRRLESLTDEEAQKIANKIQNRTTNWVQDMFFRYKAWQNERLADRGRTDRHQEDLLYLLVGMRMVFDRFRERMCPVWETPFVPGAAVGNIQLVNEGGSWLWRMPFEHEHFYPFFLQHLDSGAPRASACLRTWREQGGEYSQLMAAVIEELKSRVAKRQGEPGGPAAINESHFYRSILEELDFPEWYHSPEQYTIALIANGCAVGYDSPGGGRAGLLSAGTEEEAVQWRGLHMDWRQAFRASQEFQDLSRLRDQLKQAADTFCTFATTTELEAQVPGRCRYCLRAEGNC